MQFPFSGIFVIIIYSLNNILLLDNVRSFHNNLASFEIKFHLLRDARVLMLAVNQEKLLVCIIAFP